MRTFGWWLVVLSLTIGWCMFGFNLLFTVTGIILILANPVKPRLVLTYVPDDGSPNAPMHGWYM